MGISKYQNAAAVDNALDKGVEAWNRPTLTLPDTAEVGQVLAVKAVDDEGKPIEWKTAANGDMPVYTLAEYEEVKDTIPAGTKFAISDDEGGDDPEPTPVSDSVIEWFVVDNTHAINVENVGKLTKATFVAATGSWTNSLSSQYTICGISVNPSSKEIWFYGLKYGSSFSSSYEKTTFNSAINNSKLLIGISKSDVEEYGIKQITL